MPSYEDKSSGWWVAYTSGEASLEATRDYIRQQQSHGRRGVMWCRVAQAALVVSWVVTALIASRRSSVWEMAGTTGLLVSAVACVHLVRKVESIYREAARLPTPRNRAPLRETAKMLDLIPAKSFAYANHFQAGNSLALIKIMEARNGFLHEADTATYKAWCRCVVYGLISLLWLHITLHLPR